MSSDAEVGRDRLTVAFRFEPRAVLPFVDADRSVNPAVSAGGCRCRKFTGFRSLTRTGRACGRFRRRAVLTGCRLGLLSSCR